MARIAKLDRGMTEHQEQTLLISWLERMGIRFYAIPNGQYKNRATAAKFKREGLKSGVPDVCLPIPTKSYHGLYIELKRKKGSRVSATQVEWLGYLRSVGYYADIAYGFDEARDMVLAYLKAGC